MDIFPGWKTHIVPQKHKETSCIAWTYEMLLRIRGAEGVDYATFQDEFDLGRDHNHFGSVASDIRSKYPNIQFEFEVKPSGAEKIRFIEDLAARKIPIALSIPLEIMPPPLFAAGGFHIVPVVAIDDDNIGVMWGVEDNGEPILIKFNKQQLAKVHDTFSGGKEVSFLASP